jgi:hypothetical protein
VERVRYLIRVSSSVRIARSRMSGVARSESWVKHEHKVRVDMKREAYLALVEDVDGRPSAAEDLRVILVDGALAVADGGDVLDHHLQ